MAIDLINLLGALAAVGYVFLTYLMVRDIYNPLLSFSITQSELTHLNFDMVNGSKVEIEVFGKLWARVKNEIFSFRDGGFYDDGRHWILQPLSRGHGHFYLTDLKNKKDTILRECINNESISSINFNIELKYRRVPKNRIIRKFLKGFWKYTSPQNFVYDFNKNLLWLNV